MGFEMWLCVEEHSQKKTFALGECSENIIFSVFLNIYVLP